MLVLGKERSYVIHDDKNIKGFFGEFRYLSNFEVCDVYLDGALYGSSEAAYMASKNVDPEVRKLFHKQNGMAPTDAKKMGRKIDIRLDWDEVRYDHMAAVVFDKFSRNKYLRDKLISTEDKYLEETNHWKDTYWGVCDGIGENNLGKILMAIREFWNAKEKGKTKITTLF